MKNEITKPTGGLTSTPVKVYNPSMESQTREIRRLLTTEKQIDCLNVQAWLVMASYRLKLMFEGKREAELAILVKAWEKTEEV